MPKNQSNKPKRPKLPNAPERLYLEQWPEEAQRSDAVHYVQTGYGDDMRGNTSRITVYVKERSRKR